MKNQEKFRDNKKKIVSYLNIVLARFTKKKKNIIKIHFIETV